MIRYDLMVFSLIFLFVLTLRTGNAFFILFACIVYLIFASLRLWRWYVTQHLDAKVELHVHRVFPGEQVTGEVVIENKGRIPIFGLQLSFDFWKQFMIESDILSLNNRKASGLFYNYQGTLNIGKFEKRSIPFTMVGHDRGSYVFKSIYLSCKDPFGLDEMNKEIASFEEVLVYPKEIELQQISLTHRMPQGDTVVRRWIHDDIFFPVGSRPYQYGDAFNRIDFKASAKFQQLYTKQFDFTAHGDVCVVANLLTSNYKWDNNQEVFGRILSIVARISRESLQKDLRFSFIANAQMGRGQRVFEIPSSNGRKHYRKVLEVLARFSAFHATPFTLALSQVRKRFSNGAPIIIISSVIDEMMTKEIAFLMQSGFEVFYIDPTEPLPKIVKWHYALEKGQVLLHA